MKYNDETEVQARGMRADGASRRDISRALGITVEEAIDLEALTPVSPLTDDEYEERNLKYEGYRQVSSWERETIKALHSRGFTDEQIALQLDRAKTTITGAVHRLNVAYVDCRKITKVKRETILKLLNEGEFPAQIARRVGVHLNTVNSYRQKWEAGTI